MWKWPDWPSDPLWWHMRAIPLAICLFVALLVLAGSGVFRGLLSPRDMLAMESTQGFVMVVIFCALCVYGISCGIVGLSWHIWHNLTRRSPSSR